MTEDEIIGYFVVLAKTILITVFIIALIIDQV